MPSLTYLSPQEIDAIHQATLRILSETGVALADSEGRALLTAAGAKIQGERVLLPPDLVEKCIRQCPKTVSVRGRGGTIKTLGDGSLHFHNLGGARDILDYSTGEKRYANLQDVRDATRLLDALENCHTNNPFFTPRDVPGKLMWLSMYRHALPCTTKPLHGGAVQNPGEVKYALEMAAVIGTPAEMLTLAVSPISPLAIPDHEVQSIIALARAGIGFCPLPCPMTGMTAPLTLAGAIAQQNAEVLAPLVLAQLAHPGLPIIYCGRLSMMEPRTGMCVWGGIELGLASAGTVQIGHRYGLPVNVYGFATNAHTLDAQDGFERALNAILPALAGADELSGIGFMEAGVMGSFAQMVADNEFAASVLRLRRGFAVNDETLAVEVIATIMDDTHNFLTEKHTVKHLRSGEILMTKLAERGTWEQWEAGGKKNLAERAQTEAERILREHQVPPLDEAQEKELDRIMDAAEKELVK